MKLRPPGVPEPAGAGDPGRPDGAGLDRPDGASVDRAAVEGARFDAMVEGAGRWTASRLTRRSLFGRFGKTAMLVVGGSQVAGMLVDPAHARVCGQSGVSPKCPTYDCNDTWGWCWYAKGCCAGGALKKICDCCATNWPNVHGYCPGGTNVKCIVESCGTDPRLQTVALSRLRQDDPGALAATLRQMQYPNGSGVVVLADAEAVLATGVAMCVGSAAGAPVLTVPRSGLTPDVLAEIRRLRAKAVKIVDPWLPSSADRALQAEGIQVERVGSSTTVEALSFEVAVWIGAHLRPPKAVCMVEDALAWRTLPLATMLAASRGYPLLIGFGAAQAYRQHTERHGFPVTTFLVGPGASKVGRGMPGGLRMPNDSLTGLAADVATVAQKAEGVSIEVVAVVPAHAAATLAVAALRVPVLVHVPGVLDGARDWLYANRAGIKLVYVVGDQGTLTTASYADLQSVLNGYEAHQLTGRGGQGLPVIPQPRDERPIGRARP